jgi:hypothetical protein
MFYFLNYINKPNYIFYFYFLRYIFLLYKEILLIIYIIILIT